MRYYESLKGSGIIRFNALNDNDAIKIAKSLHYNSLIRINKRNLNFINTILPYKPEGY